MTKAMVKEDIVDEESIKHNYHISTTFTPLEVLRYYNTLMFWFVR